MVAGARGFATAISPSGWNDCCPPTGATMIGVWYRTPKISALMSTLLTSTRRRGRSTNFRKPSRLARSVTSSSMPEAM